jgi:hypothetical protein
VTELVKQISEHWQQLMLASISKELIPLSNTSTTQVSWAIRWRKRALNLPRLQVEQRLVASKNLTGVTPYPSQATSVPSGKTHAKRQNLSNDVETNRRPVNLSYATMGNGCQDFLHLVKTWYMWERPPGEIHTDITVSLPGQGCRSQGDCMIIKETICSYRGIASARTISSMIDMLQSSPIS